MTQRRFLLFAALGAIALAGCDKPAETHVTPTTPDSGKQVPGSTAKTLKIAVIPKGTGAQFWQSIKAGAEAAGKEDGCEIVWQGPKRENDVTDQVNVVVTQVNNKVDGIVLCATDAVALTNPVKDAIAKGVPVVTIDSGIKGDDALAYVATDNVKGGEAAADALAKEMGDKGKVGLLIFQKGSASSDDREKGFLAGLKKHPGLTLISTLESSDNTKALNNVTNMLTAHPDITGIFAASEPNGNGASQVIEQKKLSGKVKIVAFDSGDKEIEALKKGSIQALIVQDPFQMGYKGVKTVLKAIKKETITEKIVDSGMTVVTKVNLNTPEVQKLVHPGK